MSINAYFFDKALENLNAAELCFSNQHFNACANRAYYAAYHAAIFALSANGFNDEQNKHEWVQRTFSGELIQRRKLFPDSFKSYMFDLMETRLIADYASASVSQKKAERLLKKAREFITEIERKYPR